MSFLINELTCLCLLDAAPAAITTLKSRRTWPVLQHVDAGWTTHFLRDGTTKNFYFRRFPPEILFNIQLPRLIACICRICIYIYIFILYLGDGCINQMFMTKNSLHLAVVAFPKSANCWRSLCVYLPDHRLRWNIFFLDAGSQIKTWKIEDSIELFLVFCYVFSWKLSRLLDLLDSYKKSYCYC